MIKLTEDDFGWSYCGDQQHVIIDIAKHPRYKDPFTIEEGKQIKQQIIDDYEKARKYDEVKDGTLGFIRAFNWLDENKSIFNQANKLRELIEKKMEWASPYKDSQLMNGYLYRELRQLLKDSKK